MDDRNGEILCMVGIGLLLKRDVYRWTGLLTKTTIGDIFVSFYSAK